MSLGDVLHQRRAQESIRRAVLRGRVPHAYLFHGPDGVGKEMLAKGLAEVLLCPQAVNERLTADRAKLVGVEEIRGGCGRCEDCRAVAAGTHPDLHLIHRRLNREHPDPEVRKRKALEIGVDVLRHFVIDRVMLTPNRGRAKVFIVREADRITTQAQNALLKTLEEPPGSTVIILLVTALDLLLPTTLSRCQVVRFDPLPRDFVRQRLAAARPDLSNEQLDWYARISEGSTGRALQALDEDWHLLSRRLTEPLTAPAKLRPDKVVESWMEEAKELGDRLVKGDPDITDTEALRRGLKTVFQLASMWYAELLQHGVDAKTANGKWRMANGRGVCIQHSSFDIRHLTFAIHRLAEAEAQLELNVNTQLCLETLVHDLASQRVTVSGRAS